MTEARWIMKRLMIQKTMKIANRFLLMIIGCTFLSFLSAAHAQEKPNIVLVFLDNFGWGEPGFNGGGIIRGTATPRLDQLAAEGFRLTNFNVEVQCTPSRSAIMTGRYAIRSGNGTVPLGGGVYGLVQWEVTMAEMLSDAGYATGMFGKWHLGRTNGRFPPHRPGLRRVVRHSQFYRRVGLFRTAWFCGERGRRDLRHGRTQG